MLGNITAHTTADLIQVTALSKDSVAQSKPISVCTVEIFIPSAWAVLALEFGSHKTWSFSLILFKVMCNVHVLSMMYTTVVDVKRNLSLCMLRRVLGMDYGSCEGWPICTVRNYVLVRC